ARRIFVRRAQRPLHVEARGQRDAIGHEAGPRRVDAFDGARLVDPAARDARAYDAVILRLHLGQDGAEGGARRRVREVAVGLVAEVERVGRPAPEPGPLLALAARGLVDRVHALHRVEKALSLVDERAVARAHAEARVQEILARRVLVEPAHEIGDARV